ncbi:MAG: protein-L-isoaspartate(D-aspartate) O-methyltransferase, partial [Bradymonadaceae bacterium]
EQSRALGDYPLPIGHGQTISQPYIVAYMTEQLAVEPGDRVLEIGTGSGYQAAVLAEIVGTVYSIELLCPLANRARTTLEKQGYENIHVRCGDGYKGWPEEAPFDAIIVTAAPPEVPPVLIEQLRPGGRMVVPVGVEFQTLQIIEKSEDGSVKKTDVTPVRFVPMVPGQE